MKKTLIILFCFYSVSFSNDDAPVVYCDSTINSKLFTLFSNVSLPADSSLKHLYFQYVITYNDLDSLMKFNKFYKILIRNTASAITKSNKYKLSNSTIVLNDSVQHPLNKIDYITLFYKRKWFEYISKPTGAFLVSTIWASFFELFSMPFDHDFEWRGPVLFGSVMFTLTATLTIPFKDSKSIRFKSP
jgi:hypothetical protein